MASPKTPSDGIGPLSRLISEEEQARVVDAIRRVEQRTTGQIKVHLDERCPGEPRARAEALFATLQLAATRERNGVLVYLSVGDRKYALLGDVGIHEAVGSPFWQEAAAMMTSAFARHGTLSAGLVAAIEEIGARLAERFPSHGAHPNEIPDDLSHD